MVPLTQSIDTDTPAKDPILSTPLAGTKALGIPELLQIILQEVPVEHLTDLRRVARVWNDIISEINHIDPVSIGHGDNNNCRCLGADACAHIPHCTGRFSIRGNPVFAYAHMYRMTTKDHNGEDITPTTLRRYRGLKVSRRYDASSDSDMSGGHFITDPPISLIALSNSGFGYTPVKAMLRVSTGIRVRDLRDIFAKMNYTDNGRRRRYNARPCACYACTSDITRGSIDASNGESDIEDEDDFAVMMVTLFLAT